MRKCLRCNAEMIEDRDIKVDMQGYGISVTLPGVFGKKIAKPKVAVCPNCGEISLYIENAEKNNR